MDQSTLLTLVLIGQTVLLAAVVLAIYLTSRFLKAHALKTDQTLANVQVQQNEQALLAARIAEAAGDISGSASTMEMLAGSMPDVLNFIAARSPEGQVKVSDVSNAINFLETQTEDAHPLVPVVVNKLLINSESTAIGLNYVLSHAQKDVTRCLEQRDLIKCYEVLRRVEAIFKNHLHKCPFDKIIELDGQADGLFHLVTQFTGQLSPQVEGDRISDREQLLSATFTEHLEKYRTQRERESLVAACEQIRQDASTIDIERQGALLQIGHLDRRLARLATSPIAYEVEGIGKLVRLVSDLKTRARFFIVLRDSGESKETLSQMIKKLKAARNTFANYRVQGQTFKEFDELTSKSSPLLAMTTADIVDIPYLPLDELEKIVAFVEEQKNKAYNLWALDLITTIGTEFRDREPASLNPQRMWALPPLVEELFPKVFTVIDSALLQSEVQGLYYDLHRKLIEPIKSKYELVQELISEQICHPKKSVYDIEFDEGTEDD